MLCSYKINRGIHTLLTRIFYKNRLEGNGKIVVDSNFSLACSPQGSIKITSGKLWFGKSSIKNNKVRTVLQIKDKGQIIALGDVYFIYGADIQIKNAGKLIVGAGTYFNTGLVVRCYDEIRIGENCAISFNVTMMDSDAHSINGKDKAAKVEIGNHVLICANSTILKGVHIGDGAIIAAGSVVTHDVPKKTMVGGVPAQILRYDVDWS